MPTGRGGVSDGLLLIGHVSEGHVHVVFRCRSHVRVRPAFSARLFYFWGLGTLLDPWVPGYGSVC